ncbi:MAG: CRTAC1 family protein, partial [Planctomycetota bacterium]
MIRTRPSLLVLCASFAACGGSDADRAPLEETTPSAPAVPEQLPAPDSGVWFTDVTESAGLDFVH